MMNESSNSLKMCTYEVNRVKKVILLYIYFIKEFNNYI